tara:strand:+ start:769 stop:1674 length:906 start_codon:yes stop_codon:yes gene_type:complete
LWVTERYFHEETLSLLGFLAAATNNINLGVGVINPFTRSPSLIAMGAATLDRLSGGRFILGLGRSDKRLITGILGLDYENSLLKLNHGMIAIREMLRSKSHVIREDLKSINLSVSPVQNSLPIYMAAIGPTAIKLASKEADGVILNTYSPISYIGRALDIINVALDKNDRDPKLFNITCMLPIRLTDEVSDSLINECKYRIARILSEKFVGELLISKLNSTEYLSKLRQFVYDQNMAEIYKMITDDMVDQYYVIGDQTHCVKRINEYIDAGVQSTLLLPRLNDFVNVAEKLNPTVVFGHKH